jgi:hypothetical protein
MLKNNNEDVNKEILPTIENDASSLQFQISLLSSLDKIWLDTETKDAMEEVKNLVKTSVISDEFIAKLMRLDLTTPLANLEIAVLQETGLNSKQFDDLIKSMTDTKLESMLSPAENICKPPLFEPEGNVCENPGKTTNLRETGLSSKPYNDFLKSLIDNTEIESMLNSFEDHFNDNYSSSLYEYEGNIFENYGETTTWFADQDGSIHKSL